MTKLVETQIEQRTRLAEMHRRDQNVVERAVSGAGLAVANTWDRITQPFRSDRSVFAGATVFGVARGAVLGGIAGVLAIAVFTPAAAATVFLAATAAGATLAGIYDGQTELERHHMAPKGGFADSIAQLTHAVPTRGQAKDQPSNAMVWDLNHPDKESRVVARADKVIAEADKMVAEGESRFRERIRQDYAKRSGPNL